MSSFSQLQHAFARSFRRAFTLPGLCFLWIVLTLCGVLVVFCRGFSELTGFWGFTLAPLFLTAGVLLATGLVIVRAYLDEQRRPFHQILFSSWDLFLSSAYLGLPLFLGFLGLWVLLGVFALLFRIPFIGTFFGIVLAFVPFLLIFAIFVLCALALLLFFFATPPLALREQKGFKEAMQEVFAPLRRNLFGSLICFFIALIPVAIMTALLLAAQIFTQNAFGPPQESGIIDVLQWFFTMLPFVFLLAPAVHFFFNFAAESARLLGYKKEIP